MRDRKTSQHMVVSAALALCMLACKSSSSEVKLPGDDVVLADVGGTKVTRYDLDRAVTSLLSESTARSLDDVGRKKMLESLVRSRAIAQKREAELTPLQRLELERKVAALREEELVRQYVEAHTTIQPVTGEMVERYYNDHPELFGGRVTHSYELLTSTAELTAGPRTTLIKALEGAGKRDDWAAWAAELVKQHLPVAHQHGSGDEAALHPSLRGLIEQLKPGETSSLTFIQGRAYLVRVTAENRAAPRPIGEVSAEIRKSLVPMQLKKSVEQATTLALKDAKVKYR
jgi:hypothetical protein